MSGDRYTIRSGTCADIPRLCEIEKAAAQLFPPERLAEPSPVSPETMQQGVEDGLVWVLDCNGSEAVGFAICQPQEEGNFLHLLEMDVHPEHGAQGLGTLLLRHVIEYARQECIQGVTLTTFSDMKWNAPFYSKNGFVPIPESELDADLQKIVADEQRRGLINRVAMRLAFDQNNIASVGRTAPAPAPSHALP